MTNAAPKPTVGRVLAGRYHVEAVLGRGAMGSVYRARDTQTNRTCAIKLMAQLAALDDSAYLRFIQEAQIVAQLYHPNIVQVYGFDRDEDGTPILAMELLEGDDLHTALYDTPRMPLDRTLEILRAVGQALHAAHSVGVLHRDIKPKNIFLAKQKNSRGDIHEVVKVVDFGLSKVLGSQNANETAPGIILGTAEYISPEGTLGVPELLDFRADQWALGVVAYRMLSGRLPFEGSDPLSLLLAIRKTTPTPLRQLVSDVPEHVLVAIERAMAKNKEERFESVQDFLRALDGLPTIGQVLSRSSDGVPALMGVDFAKRSGLASSMSGSLRLSQGSLGGGASSANSGRHALANNPSSRSGSQSGDQHPSSRSGRQRAGSSGDARPAAGQSANIAPIAAAMTADALPSMPSRSLFRTIDPASEYSVHVTGHLVGNTSTHVERLRGQDGIRRLWMFAAVPSIALATAGLLWLGHTHLGDRPPRRDTGQSVPASSQPAPLPQAAPSPIAPTAPAPPIEIPTTAVNVPLPTAPVTNSPPAVTTPATAVPAPAMAAPAPTPNPVGVSAPLPPPSPAAPPSAALPGPIAPVPPATTSLPKPGQATTVGPPRPTQGPTAPGRGVPGRPPWGWRTVRPGPTVSGPQSARPAAPASGPTTTPAPATAAPAPAAAPPPAAVAAPVTTAPSAMPPPAPAAPQPDPPSRVHVVD